MELEKKLHTRQCPHCKQPYQTTVGIHNMKNLFRKPTLDDIITLVILLMVIAAFYAYQYDTKTCRDTLNNIQNICLSYCNGIAQSQAAEKEYYANYSMVPINLTMFNETNTTVINKEE